MISIFNRAILLKDSNAEAAAKARAALNAAGIPFRQKTAGDGSAKPAVRVPRTGRTGTMGTGFSGGVYMAGGVPHSWAEGAAAKTVYIIFVRKKELKRAKEICNIG